MACCDLREREQQSEEMILSLRYADDIVRTVKGDPEEFLRDANPLHPNLQFTIKKAYGKGNFDFLTVMLTWTSVETKPRMLSKTN